MKNNTNPYENLSMRRLIFLRNEYQQAVKLMKQDRSRRFEMEVFQTALKEIQEALDRKKS